MERVDGVAVARCKACDEVTTVRTTEDGGPTTPRIDDCQACGGLLELLEETAEETQFTSSLVEGPQLRRILLQKLVRENGEMTQDELISTTNRSPHLVRQAIQRLEEDGLLTRDTHAGTWHVALVLPEADAVES